MKIVIGIHREKQLAMLEDGSLIPVTHWIDEDGDDCPADEAVVCVAGTDEGGWYTVDLSDFSKAGRMH
jgi:hypothetical protein